MLHVSCSNYTLTASCIAALEISLLALKNYHRAASTKAVNKQAHLPTCPAIHEQAYERFNEVGVHQAWPLHGPSALDLLRHSSSSSSAVELLQQQQSLLTSQVAATTRPHSAARLWSHLPQHWHQQQQLVQVRCHQHQIDAAQQWQQRCYTTNNSSSSSSSSPPSSSSGSSRPKSSKGALPKEGPSHKILKALPFLKDRAAAEAAFNNYHSKLWYQSKQRPALHKPFKESYLPFWVGSGSVDVEVRGAEVGHEHLVTRYNKQTGKAEPRWETVWNRVSLHLSWTRHLKPEDKDMQVYASWKYFRRDVQALAPGELISVSKPITPDMLQASTGSGLGTRRVGPFTLNPVAARRLLMAAVESQERARAEAQIGKLLGASQVRFVDLHCTWHGSTGAAAATSGTLRSAAAAAAAAKGGLDLSPVYVPAYVFSWWHGGTKVRTFVSGVNVTTAGVHVLDDTKLATLAAAGTATLGLLFGLPLHTLFWASFVLPFFSTGFVARFWPLLRTIGLDLLERFRHRTGFKFWQQGQHDDYCEVDWNAAFVHSYDQYERQQQQAEQRQSYSQPRRPAEDFAADFQQIFRDPLGWFESMYARQQQQQQGAEYTKHGSANSGQEWQQQYKAHRQQARYERSSSGG